MSPTPVGPWHVEVRRLLDVIVVEAVSTEVAGPSWYPRRSERSLNRAFRRCQRYCDRRNENVARAIDAIDRVVPGGDHG